MRVAVSSGVLIQDVLAEWKPDAVLTILSPTMRCQPFEGVRHLRLACHDIEVLRLGRLRPPTLPLVEAALAFGREGHERLLVHCLMGLSRSPALAIAILVQQGRAPGEAVDAVARAIPTASPNRLILRLAEMALGLEAGAITTALAGAFTGARTLTGARGKPVRWVEV